MLGLIGKDLVKSLPEDLAETVLRDLYAGAALNAILIRASGDGLASGLVAERAFAYAEAMLKERKRYVKE